MYIKSCNIYPYYNKRIHMYIKSCFEIVKIVHRIFFNKYKMKLKKRSLHHLVGNLILYNFCFTF